MREYREGQLALLRMTVSEAIVAGRVSHQAGEPRFFIEHPVCETGFLVGLRDTRDYKINVVATGTLQESRNACEKFDLCYTFSERFLSDVFPADRDFSLVAATAACMILEFGRIDPNWLRAAHPPSWLEPEVSKIILLANDNYRNFVAVAASHCFPKVLH